MPAAIARRRFIGQAAGCAARLFDACWLTVIKTTNARHNLCGNKIVAGLVGTLHGHHHAVCAVFACHSCSGTPSVAASSCPCRPDTTLKNINTKTRLWSHTHLCAHYLAVLAASLAASLTCLTESRAWRAALLAASLAALFASLASSAAVCATAPKAP